MVVYFSTATNRRSRGALWSIIAPPFILGLVFTSLNREVLWGGAVAYYLCNRCHETTVMVGERLLTGSEAGIDLKQLLWVRCGKNAEYALKATDLVVQAGGFGMVVLDLEGVPAREARRISSPSLPALPLPSLCSTPWRS